MGMFSPAQKNNGVEKRKDEGNFVVERVAELIEGENVVGKNVP